MTPVPFLPALLALSLAVAPPPSPTEGLPLPDEPAPALAAAPATATLTTPRFRIVHTARAAGAARSLAGQIEPLRDDVARVLGRDWPGVTEVRLGYGRAEYEALAPPGQAPPSWAVALAWPEQNVVLVEAHSLVQGDGQLTLRHELAHVALGQLGRGWPRWFQEGLAQELTGERRYRLEQYAILARAVQQERVFRFEELARGFPARPEDVEVAYAQSAAFVAFLRERHGAAGFGQLVDFVRAGDPFETAFGKAFHAPLSTEERDFKAELPRRYPLWPLVTGGTTLWALLAVLLVVAFVRRRREVAGLRAALARKEAEEDAAFALLASLAKPANDDVDPLAPPAQPQWPWLVSLVRRRGDASGD